MAPEKSSRDSVNSAYEKAFPEQSDADPEAASGGDGDAHDRWLRDNVPPHHE